MAATDPRVLGVARALFSGTELPASQQDFVFDFIGLVGRADPLRQNVPAVVRECQTAGIRVVMITGDYPATAREIACQAGLAGSDVVTGDELETSTPVCSLVFEAEVEEDLEARIQDRYRNL